MIYRVFLESGTILAYGFQNNVIPWRENRSMKNSLIKCLLGLIIAVSQTVSASPTIDSFDSTRIGRTSKGGVNQANANFSTGITASYGDVWRASHIFDISSLLGSGSNNIISSVRLDIVVGGFRSDQIETLSVGGYTGSLSTLKAVNFTSPNFSTNTAIYPTLAPVSYGSVTLDSSVSRDSLLSIFLDSSGVDYVQQTLNDNLAEIAFGTRFGFNTWSPVDRYLTPASSKLVVEYMQAPASVSSPVTVSLVLMGLILLVRIQKNTAPG